MLKAKDYRKTWTMDCGWLKVPGENLCHLIASDTADQETGLYVSLTACEKEITITRVDHAAGEHIVKDETKRCGVCLSFIKTEEVK